MGNKQYHSEDYLRTQYVERGKSTTEIADECGVTHTTIQDWLDRHGIERRSQREAQRPEKPYTDESWLREQYLEEEYTMRELSEECGVSAATILKWLRRFDIETRGEAEYKFKSPAQYYVDMRGYPAVRSKCNGEQKQAFVHQLIAIADGADPQLVFSSGAWHCHHKNHIRFDNRPGNIEFKHASDHMRDHMEERERAETGEVK